MTKKTLINNCMVFIIFIIVYLLTNNISYSQKTIQNQDNLKDAAANSDLGIDLITPFSHDQFKQNLYVELAQNLRCPTCTGLSILQSDAIFSKQIKFLLIEKINSGATKQQIMQFFTDRYGVWILRQPPKNSTHILIWLIPLLLLLICPLYLIICLLKSKNTPLILNTKNHTNHQKNHQSQSTAPDSHIINININDIKNNLAKDDHIKKLNKFEIDLVLNEFNKKIK